MPNSRPVDPMFADNYGAVASGALGWDEAEILNHRGTENTEIFPIQHSVFSVPLW